MYDPQYLIVVEYPHTWASDMTARFSNPEEAKTWGKKFARGKPGQEEYARVTLYTVVENIN